MAVSTYTKTGTKASTPAKLDKSVFGVEVNQQLLKEAYVNYLANQRANYAKAKTRGDVSGGGQKPWRQKGTGRARFGSSRNPIWRGGGAAFGPTGNETYQRQMPSQAKRTAIRQALSLKAEADAIKIVNGIASSDGKTKSLTGLLTKIEAIGRVLIITPAKDELLSRSAQNLSTVKVCSANQLTVYDLLNADQIVISQDALSVIEQWLGAKSQTKKTEAVTNG